MYLLIYLLTELINDGLEHENGSGASKDSERLTGEQTIRHANNEAGYEALHGGHVVPGGVSK